MKKLIFSIFVVIWSINLVPVLELIKIENLLVHYIKHKSESDHFSLYQFLTMHYLNTPVQDDDYEEDMQLPFKSLISTFSFSTFHYPPVIYSFTSVLNTPSDEVTSFVSGFSIYKSEFIFNIWQPPRQS